MIITTSPKGTEDLLPADSYRWQYLEKNFKETADLFNYKEVRVPTFEHTELFERGVGGTTDVVEKQMYTFLDKGGRSVTLRPEGTASVARSFIENSLFALPMPMKMFYNIACFRYENKQKGRLREFHQFGVEAFGAKNPTMDAEVVSLALTFLDKVGLKDLSVNINSIGCPTCRKAYSDALKEYFRPHFDTLCSDCKGRFERNPLRIIDCKVPTCHELVDGAPTILDYLCDECREHFEGFRACLDGMGIKYTVDPGIVRGLDYYTKTVFEIISGDFTVCGGGRYDGLVEEIGGKPCPAVGFGLGIERLLLRLEETGVELPEAAPVKIYIAPLGDRAVREAQSIVYSLRSGGVSADTDHFGRGLRASMKYADKLGAEYTMVIGDNEIDERAARVKNMATGEETLIKFDEIADFLS